LVLNFFAFSPFPLFALIILTPLFGFLTAQLPDDAAGAELAVEAGVGAGPAGVQALLAVAELHLLAQDAGVPVRMVAAFIHKFHK
jgi:hypothetical protein